MTAPASGGPNDGRESGAFPGSAESVPRLPAGARDSPRSERACRQEGGGVSLACRRDPGDGRTPRDVRRSRKPARPGADGSGRDVRARRDGAHTGKHAPPAGPCSQPQDRGTGGGLGAGRRPWAHGGLLTAAFAACLAVGAPAPALDLAIPDTVTVAVETTDAASVRLPEAPWSQDALVAGTEGAIRKTVLRLPDAQWTSLQLIAPFRDRLEKAGYFQVFSCADAECGGFDFRFQLDLIGEPEMHVDLGNYRYLLMRHPSREPHSVAIVASPTSSSGNVHVTEVSSARFPETEPDAGDMEPEADDDADRAARAPGALAASLLQTGHAVLYALEFGSGSADLRSGPHPVLAELAAWLLDNPSARIVLVGHTDAKGSLEANTALSRRRAEAVAGRLAEAFDIDPSRLEAAGAGYLSPIKSNLTETGRTANRRVEAVLVSLE